MSAYHTTSVFKIRITKLDKCLRFRFPFVFTCSHLMQSNLKQNEQKNAFSLIQAI